MWGRTRLGSLLLLAGLGVLLPAADAGAAAGELDATFGSGGVVKLLESHEESLAQAGAIQPDGKIVVAGLAKGAVDEELIFARYNVDGSPDTGFGSGGVVPVHIGTRAYADAVAVGADGKLVATGRAKVGEKYVLAIAVLLASGAPDTSFDADGVKTIETKSGNDLGVAVAVLGEGRILVGDAAGAGGGDGFYLLQLLANGAPDPGFGGGSGEVLTPIPTGGLMTGSGRVTDFALRGDGRIVASGYGFDYGGPRPPTTRRWRRSDTSPTANWIPASAAAVSTYSSSGPATTTRRPSTWPKAASCCWVPRTAARWAARRRRCDSMRPASRTRPSAATASCSGA